MVSITKEQLRAAFLAWEQDVRNNRHAFVTDEEARAQPIEEHADNQVAVILKYAGIEA
jgi:hypothetical protein